MGLALFSAWRLAQNSDEVYRLLDEIWTRARAADTEAQLLQVRTDLVEFHRRRCCFRHYGNYARRVLAYIDGRLSSPR